VAAGAKQGLALLDQLGLTGDVILIGHSAGAPVALELAALAPERVKGLVLIAPAVFLDSPLANASLSTYVNLAYTQVDMPDLMPSPSPNQRRETLLPPLSLHRNPCSTRPAKSPRAQVGASLSTIPPTTASLPTHRPTSRAYAGDAAYPRRERQFHSRGDP
jgi:pimeloyl-ACP methyl ester carboxylesterase